jgi:hypothetical protein
MIKLDLSSPTVFGHHRYGWKYCVSQLAPLHSRGGILLDTFIEYTFGNKIAEYYKGNMPELPYNKPWIGFMHNPPNAPEWFDSLNSCDAVIGRGVFKRSAEFCKCIITLSKYLKNHLKTKLDIPIIDVKYPTNMRSPKWSVEKFSNQKHIPLLQIGYWLRNINLIKDIDCNNRFIKIWLPSNNEYVHELRLLFDKTTKDSYESHHKWNGIAIPKKIEDYQYDDLMARSIVCLELYDSSANTAIVESIARNTPIIINKLPSVVEYLGEDYPLYFKDRNDIPKMIEDKQLIISGHKYLKQMDKTELSGTFFLKDLHNKLEKTLC